MVKSKQQTADLRIVVRTGNDYAVAFYAHLQGNDLYYGPRLSAGSDLFKATYHESGKAHLRVPTRGGRLISEPSVPLAKVKGKKHLGASSGDQKMLEWGYKPKPDSPTRRTKILDAEDINAPSWTTELWALEPGRPELVGEAIKFYSPEGVVVDYVLAEWPSPNLLIVIWTLKSEGWAALERSVKGGT